MTAYFKMQRGVEAGAVEQDAGSTSEWHKFELFNIWVNKGCCWWVGASVKKTCTDDWFASANRRCPRNSIAKLLKMNWPKK